MTHFTTYTDGTAITAASGGNAASAPAMYALEGIFDAAQRNLAAEDTAAVITIPAGTYVYAVFYEVITGDATQTMDVGDGDDPNGWVAAADVATAGNTGVGAGALAGGKYYATADTLDIQAPATKAFDALKVRIVAHVGTVGL